MQLKDIKSPKDIKGLGMHDLEAIASEMREAILNRTSAIGGHVGPNLGAVEAIIAMHYVFNAPIDKLVYDVSHQAFAHKMLTGRVDGYINPEYYKKIGEYTDPKESPEYDLFYAGHTSPALSLCVGLAKARDIAGDKYNVVALVGDGALSGGEALEGLDAGGALHSNLICIFNDNQMAIAGNHGGMYSHFRHLRETNGTASDNLFKAFGWNYIYVAEGNNVEKLIQAYKKAKDSDLPTVIHINTQKGEGYVPAEEYREDFHYSNPYDIASGNPKKISPDPTGDIIREFVKESARKYPEKFLAISAAYPEALGLGESDREALGKHYLDVGIAEQTAVATMAGAAKNGGKVIFAVVATFLQRAYDQLVEDWAMDDSPALIVVEKTGVRGIVDQTHLGFWDIPMITSIPDVVYLAPANLEEYKAMLEWGLSQNKFKVAVREPVYSAEHADYEVDADYSDLNKFKVLKEGSKVAVIAVGDFLVKGYQVCELLEKEGIRATLINPRFVSGIDKDLLESLKQNHTLVVTLEDGSVEGGFGQRIASAYGDSDMKVLNFGLEKKFVDRYNPSELEMKYGLLPDQIAVKILKTIQ